MYGVNEVGKYNVDYEGISYDGKIPYQMVIISEFVGIKEVHRKTLYFRDNIGTDRNYVIPPMKTETQINQFSQYPNNAKLKAYRRLLIEKE